MDLTEQVPMVVITPKYVDRETEQGLLVDV